jgi:putative peptidoglycan lipid II flippase
VIQGMLCGVVVVVVFLGVAYPLDRRDVRPMVAAVAGRLRRVGGRRRTDAGDGEAVS